MPHYYEKIDATQAGSLKLTRSASGCHGVHWQLEVQVASATHWQAGNFKFFKFKLKDNFKLTPSRNSESERLSWTTLTPSRSPSRIFIFNLKFSYSALPGPPA